MGAEMGVSSSFFEASVEQAGMPYFDAEPAGEHWAMRFDFGHPDRYLLSMVPTRCGLLSMFCAG